MHGSLEQTIFSPLSKEYCVYFLWLTIIAFIFFVIAVIDVIVQLVKGKEGIWRGIISLIFPFLIYFNNRLLYSMCVK